MLVYHGKGEDANLWGDVRDALLQTLRFHPPVRLQIELIFDCVLTVFIVNRGPSQYCAMLHFLIIVLRGADIVVIKVLRTVLVMVSKLLVDEGRFLPDRLLAH